MTWNIVAESSASWTIHSTHSSWMCKFPWKLARNSSGWKFLNQYFQNNKSWGISSVKIRKWRLGMRAELVVVSDDSTGWVLKSRNKWSSLYSIRRSRSPTTKDLIELRNSSLTTDWKEINEWNFLSCKKIFDLFRFYAWRAIFKLKSKIVYVLMGWGKNWKT